MKPDQIRELFSDDKEVSAALLNPRVLLAMTHLSRKQACVFGYMLRKYSGDIDIIYASDDRELLVCNGCGEHTLKTIKKAIAQSSPPTSFHNPPKLQPMHQPTPPQAKLVYTSQELCAALGVSAVTLWRLEKRSLLKPVAGLRHKIYSKAEVDRFLAGEKSL